MMKKAHRSRNGMRNHFGRRMTLLFDRRRCWSAFEIDINEPSRCPSAQCETGVVTSERRKQRLRPGCEPRRSSSGLLRHARGVAARDRGSAIPQGSGRRHLAFRELARQL